MREADQGALAAKLAARRAVQAQTAAEAAQERAQPQQETAESLAAVPDFMMHTLDELASDDVSEVASDEAVDRIVSAVSIVDAYKRWVPKPFPVGHEGRDEIQVSCPTPSHTDRVPSASLNTKENLWICYGCDARGDVLGLIAGQLGMDTRVPQEFMALRKQICRDLGHEFYTNSYGHEELIQGERPTKPAPTPEVETHDAPEEFFDLAEEVAAGEYDRAQPLDLTEVAPEIMDTLSEMDDMGAKVDGVSVHSSVMEKLNAKAGDKKPTPPAPKPNPKPEPKPTPTPEQPQRRGAGPSVVPKFNVSKLDEGLSTTPKPIEPEKPVEKPAEKPAPKAKAKPEPDADEPEQMSKEQEAVFVSRYPHYDWRTHIPEGTPLHDFMLVASTDDSPEEYHVSNFLMLIGLIMGRKVFLVDKFPVYGNIVTCIVGRSGIGKSNSEKHVDWLIERVMRFDELDVETDGIRVIRSAGSGPYLTSMFRHEVEVEVQDSSGKSKKEIQQSKGVRGLVRWPELSGMLGKADTNTERIKSTIIEIYDAAMRIGGGSLTNKDYSAFNAFGSVATTTQTKSLTRIVGQSDVHSGFMNRFWFIFGPEKEREPRGVKIDLESAVPGVQHIVKWVDEKAASIAYHGQHDFIDISVSGESGEWFDRYMRQVVFPMQKADETDMLVRLDLTFKKLVLLFSANMQEKFVSVAALEQAKSYFEYLCQCYGLVTNTLSSTELGESEIRVVETIKKYENGKGSTGEGTVGPTMREIYDRGMKGTMKSITELSRLVSDLVRSGIIREVPPKRPNGSKRYRSVEG